MNEAKKILNGSSVIFIGTVVGSFFSYLFNMLVGRMLGPQQYGEFATLLSLLMIASVFSGAVLTVTMKYSSELFTLKKYSGLVKLFKYFSKYAFFLGVFLFLLSLIFVKPISNFFQIKDLLSIIITLFSFIFGFLIVVNRGILQGTQKFIACSILGVLEPAFRLVIGIVLIKLGFAIGGAMTGVVLSTVVAYFISFGFLKKIFMLKKKSDNFVFNKKEIINYTGPTFIATVLLMISMNVDILLVKHYFNPEDAGIYAAISTVGKIILYATAPIVTVMFPMISEKKALGDKHFKLFFLSLVFTILGGLVILGLYYIAPGTIIRALYGQKYTDYFYLLPPVGFAVLFYALISLLSNYFLAVKNFIFLYIFAAVVLLQIMLIANFHSSLETVIKIMILTFGLLTLLLLGYYLFTKKEQIALYFKGEYES